MKSKTNPTSDRPHAVGQTQTREHLIMAEKATAAKTSKQASKRKAAEQRATEQAAKPTLENIYEAMFLLGPTAATEPQAGLDLCRGFIERHGGKIKVLKKWD